MKRWEDYSKLPEPEKSRKALADFERFVGSDRFTVLKQLVKGHDETWIRKCCAIMLEVEGFPVTAFIKRHCPDIIVHEAKPRR